MYKIFILVFGFTFTTQSQTINDCKKRFNTYLNFKGKLNANVKFDSSAIYISAAGKLQTVIYANELKELSVFFSNATLLQQQRLLDFKGTKRLSTAQLDSISNNAKRLKNNSNSINKLPLQGYKIAIDPGHFATNLTEAKCEQKFLYFLKDSSKAKRDTVKLFESLLTYNTAKLLENRLREQGADVFMTRTNSNFTSFNCTYSDWLKYHKQRVLDSLKTNKLITLEKYSVLKKADGQKFFWDFFRDMDLANRARKINEFEPNLTLIIHYNVDEKNAPWKNTTNKNFTMAFIGGAFTSSDIDKKENRTHFIRMLVSQQLNQSEELAQKTVKAFNKNLDVKIATANDADYLKNNCLASNASGVFCRNLFLCRKVNSVLVYGESLYQDNEKEVAELMKSDLDLYGIKANARLEAVSRSYYEAVLQFCRNE